MKIEDPVVFGAFLIFHVSTVLGFLKICFGNVDFVYIKLMVICAYIHAVSIELICHRFFSHGSFKTSRAFQFILGIFATITGQSSPVWWSSNHIKHHAYSDTPDDPHSPCNGGFLHAHIAWLWETLSVSNPDKIDWVLVKHLKAYPELMVLDKFRELILLAYAFIIWYLHGWYGVWFGFLCGQTLGFNMVFTVNSVCHWFGSQTYFDDSSRNVWWLLPVLFGANWHNNHHQYPKSATLWFKWYELDGQYLIIKFLEMVGLVWDVNMINPLTGH